MLHKMGKTGIMLLNNWRHEMNVYRIAADTKNNSHFYHYNWKEYTESIIDIAIWQGWKPIDTSKIETPCFELLKSDTGKKNYKFDICSSSEPFLIFSEQAIEALSDILTPRGQFIDIKTDSKRKKFVGFYPLNPLSDILDKEKSDINIQTENTILYNNIFFIEKNITDDYLFSLSESYGNVFVTDKFKKRVEDAGLVGFDFSGKVNLI